MPQKQALALTPRQEALAPLEFGGAVGLLLDALPPLDIPELSATIDLIVTIEQGEGINADPVELSLDGTFTDYPILADGTFASLVVQSRFLKLLADRVEEARSGVTDSIEALFMAAGLDESMEKALTLGPFRARISRSMSVTLSKEKLLEQGVSPDVIKKATTRKPGTYVSVTTVKEKA